MTPTFNAKFTFGPPMQVLERPAAGCYLPSGPLKPRTEGSKIWPNNKHCFNCGDSSCATAKIRKIQKLA